MVITLFHTDRFRNSFQFSSQSCGRINFESLYFDALSQKCEIMY